MELDTLSQMELKVFVPGIYPRSEALVQATRDLDRGRTTTEAVEEQAARDRRELVAAQQAAGLAPLSDGLLGWQDIFRPLAEASDGLEARPLARYLDTNTFYRALLVESEPRLRNPLPAPDVPGGWLGTLPSPLAFSRAAGDAVSAEKLAADVLGPQIEAWSGADLIVLSEPFAAREGAVVELARALAELPTGTPLVLQLPFADAAPVLPALADAPVSAIGVDFYSTGIDAIPQGYPKEIVAGVVDARSSALERPEEIASFAGELAARDPAGLSLAPNGDLQFVPEPIAREKLARLGRSHAVFEEAA
jgi:5-methyltetrahydropteroyltriglutamate--homocysteine methyltransferase